MENRLQMQPNQEPHPDHDTYIVGIREGKRKVITHIYDENRDRMLGWMTKNSISKEAAADIFQDAMVAIVEKSLDPKFVLTCPFGAFLYQICKNKLYNFLRQKKKHDIRIEDYVQLQGDTSSAIHLSEDALREQEWQKLLDRNFLKLSAKCQKILNLLREDKSVTEIKQLLEIDTANAVYQARFRCGDRWRKLVEEDPNYTHCKPLNW